MFQTDKNRMVSSKTVRSSQSENNTVKNAAIVLSVAKDTQPAITLEAVKRVLEVGKLLRAVLTSEELNELGGILNKGKHKSDASSQRDLVIPAALDAPYSTMQD